ncbi:hypothetical protein PISMIDRAFT_685571 [Pisolithus microcarpus 441]|uniref:Uncharacterized protein n=1 Tax=Pisolithus microcarpus 441 TaxID=765257 RepID=A0A0C9ZB94_9AGAM|nr:hypothetical protein PISMIDRAFT_685571 [Pisolithus microcarpus 441]
MGRQNAKATRPRLTELPLEELSICGSDQRAGDTAILTASKICGDHLVRQTSKHSKVIYAARNTK